MTESLQSFMKDSTQNITTAFIQSELSQKEKHQYSILMHIYAI